MERRVRVCGAMDNASAYGAEDSRFDPWQTRDSWNNLSYAFHIIPSQLFLHHFSLPAD